MIRFPIVGAFYRPPAAAIIRCMAIDTPLSIWAEPSNPVDPNAIAVMLTSVDFPKQAHPALEEALAPFGKSLQEFLDEEMWHLGYVPKNMTNIVRANGFTNESPASGTFGVNPKGEPRFVLTPLVPDAT